ncbi:MAG: replication factor C large subunit [Promethearchaeota archaeon]
MEKKKNNNIPWVEKYRPKSIKEMALPQARVNRHRVNLAEELIQFVESFFEEMEKINEENKKIKAYNRTAPSNKQKKLLSMDPKKAALLLEGPPGIGKTSLVYALAHDLNMEVIETNASDTRTRKALENKLKETTRSKGILDFIIETKRKLILIDEVDGIYGVKDKGAIPAILDLIQQTQFPIIMCSNEYKQNLQPIYDAVKKYEVLPLSKEEILKITRTIIKKEKITNLTKEDLELIIDKNNGDLRGIINDLQGMSQEIKDEDKKQFIYSLYRNNTIEIFTLIRDLFQKANSLREARMLVDQSDVDYALLYKWINENLPSFAYNNDELAEALENLTLADEIYGRIRKNMEWSLLPYFFDLFAGGVTLAISPEHKSKGFRRVTFPRYIMQRSLSSLSVAERNLIEKIKIKHDMSDREIIKDFLPFLRLLGKSSRKMLKEISDWLELEAREKKLIR